MESLLNAGVILQAPVEVGVGLHLESDCQRGCTPCCVTNDYVQYIIHIKSLPSVLELRTNQTFRYLT
jgi:hypothetical protein